MTSSMPGPVLPAKPIAAGTVEHVALSRAAAGCRQLCSADARRV